MTSNELQTQYLKNLCDNQLPLAMYLINGIKLSGIIADFDEHVVILKDSKNTLNQLIYKHAIATIVPHGKPHE